MIPQVHVEYVVEIGVKFNKGAFCWSTLCHYITVHGTNKHETIDSSTAQYTLK